MRHIRRASLATGVGAVLVAGVLVFVPDTTEPSPPAPGPEARARAAVGAGAPAALPDLTALIRDRETWLREHPKDGRSWAVLGAAYVERGSLRAETAYYPKAERALRRSLDLSPAGKTGAARRAGGAGVNGGADGGGAEMAGTGTADEGGGGNLEALTGLASLANARHDYVSAKKWGETVRKLKPTRWTTYPVLIDAYNGLGDYPAAGRALDKLQELRSGAGVLSLSSQVYRDRGRPEDAAAKATEAVTLADTPEERAGALHRLGELAWERGEPKEALAHYHSALDVAREHGPSLAGRARTLAALGRTDEAIQGYQAAIDRRPLPEYALELGELYGSLGLDGDARSQYAMVRERAAKAQGDGVNQELVLARFEADHGAPDSAVLRLEAQWRRHHRDVRVADALAWALYRAGDAKKALPYAKRATEQGPRSALFSYHRGEIERALGMTGPARRHLEEALRTNPRFSPVLAPKAKESLEALGELPEGGPKQMYEDGKSTPLTPPAEPVQPSTPASAGHTAKPVQPSAPARRVPPVEPVPTPPTPGSASPAARA